MVKVTEKGVWKARWKLEKYHEDITPFEGRESEFYAKHRPYEVIEREGNLLLNEGINAMWNLICGAGGTAFDNTNARVGVGDSNTAAAATQTDLQGANKTYKGMEAGYPTSGTTQKATFRSSFGSGEGNHVWAEWTVDNGAGAALNLNRKVESLGTKSGGTWVLTVELSLS